MVAPQTFLQSAKGDTSLPESCTDVVIDVCVIGQYAAQIAEVAII